MGHHGQRKHKKKLETLIAETKNKNAVREGILVLPEAGEDHTPPRSIHIDADAHQNTGPDLLLHVHRHVQSFNVRQVQTASKAVVVKTVIHVVHENGSTVGTFTVETLPATVSNSEIGIVTIPAESDSPITVSALPSATSASHTASVSIPATESPSLSEPVTLPSASETAPSIPVSQSPPPAASDHQTSGIITSPADVILIPSVTPETPVVTLLTPSSLNLYPVIPTSASETSIIPPISSSDIVSLVTSIVPSIASSIPPSISTSSSPLVSTPSSILLSTATTTSSSTTSSTSTSTSSVKSSVTSSTSTTLFFGGGGGAPTENSGPAPTNLFDNQGQTSKTDGLSPPRVIGAVVGSVSGFVLILLIILFTIRSRKRKSSQTRALSEGAGSTMPAEYPPRPGFSSSARSSAIIANFFAPARALSRWRDSDQSLRTEEFVPAQRGFEKLGGRKLKSVLETGGDGYDNEFGVSEKVYESGALTKDIGVGVASASYDPPLNKEIGQSRTIPSPPLGRPASQESDSSEKVLFRPSPARAITTESSVSGTDVPTTARTGMMTRMMSPQPPPRSSMRAFSGDAIGRSHASADGSCTSRFTEGI
ncbi:predicted protein [Uncinocarpus reesii 1704]|uniref:Mid2 domain-containing protein n=1 Tax=Uncinocarpus reesii (strain UAMH 1704) TaxID=336963 RepID=C4JZD5_UNCRE|nr:uncharacterized protein UREG_07536 [Uncinocarpus reesii 1704]EEP82671.1 predicted protein [Uncinocarpus reesii 1704]